MLKLDGIKKRYGDRTVLDDVGFEVGAGRLTGFVGGNGAGKTTTMRILLGVLASDAGRITLDDAELTDQARRQFGYMPEERGLYPKMHIREQLVYLARLHGLTQQDATESTDELLDALELTGRANDALEGLSLGNQQRVQVAAALVHRPNVLVLDEPFSGLDPLAVDVVVEVLKARAATGVPVLFSSHQLDVVERLCDDLVILAGGSIRAAGSREALAEQHGSPSFELEAATDLGWLRAEPGVSVLEFDGGHAVFDATDDVAQGVLRRALDAGPVTTFRPRRASLATIFREAIR